MASDETNQDDLWSARSGAADVPRDPRRRLLPHDLDVALKYLTNGELKALAAAVGKEQERRGQHAEATPWTAPKPVLAAQPSSSLPSVDGLTQSQVSLIRASIKAGVKPGALSRQFGISQAHIRAALK